MDPKLIKAEDTMLKAGNYKSINEMIIDRDKRAEKVAAKVAIQRLEKIGKKVPKSVRNF